jgi:hypothetical protein
LAVSGNVLSWIASDGSGSSRSWPSDTPAVADSLTPMRAVGLHASIHGGWNIWILPLERTRASPCRHDFLELGASFALTAAGWLRFRRDRPGMRFFCLPAPAVPGGIHEQALIDLGPRRPQLFPSRPDGSTPSASSGPEFRAQAAKPLFKGRFEDFGGVSPDGQRFLMLKGPDAEPAPPQIVVIPDWFDELRERLRRPSK